MSFPLLLLLLLRVASNVPRDLLTLHFFVVPDAS